LHFLQKAQHQIGFVRKEHFPDGRQKQTLSKAYANIRQRI